MVSRIVDLVDASGQEVIVTAGGRRLEASRKPVAHPLLRSVESAAPAWPRVESLERDLLANQTTPM